MSTPRRLGVRAQLALLLALVVLPSLGVVGYLIQTQRTAAIEDAQQNARLLASHAESTLDALVSQMRRLLGTLAYVPAIRSGSAPECSALLARVLEKTREFGNFGFLAPDGEMQCSGLPYPPGMNFSDRDYFKEVVGTREFTVSGYLIGRLMHAPVIVFAHPVLDDEGKALIGVLYASLPLAWISHQFESALMPPGSVMELYDPSGLLLARYPHDDTVGRTRPESRVFQSILRNRATGTTVLEGADGVKRLYAFNSLLTKTANLGAYIAVGLPADAAFAKVHRVTLRSIIVFSGAVALVLLLGWWGTDFLFARPLGELVAATKRLSLGDLGTRAPDAFEIKEFSELGRAFNQMAGALEERHRELEDYIRRLDRLNRVRAILSGISSALLRIKDKQTLLEEVCRIAVDQGRLRLAWVGLLDESRSWLVFAAHAGIGRECFAGLRIPMDPAANAERGPARQAVLTNGPVVWDRIQDDPLHEDWRERAELLGYRSAVALPIRIDDRIVGALSLYSEENGFFNEDEIRVLLDLAADTGLGLSHIEKGERIEQLVYYDQLTGLANPSLVEDRIDQAIARARFSGRHVAAVVLDVRGLKHINDLFGRRAGDEALRAVAESLKPVVREGDTVGRLAGDDFVLGLVDMARPSDVTQILREILDAVPSSVEIEGERISINVRMGVAIYPSDGQTATDLVRNASLALDSAAGQETEPFVLYSSSANAVAHENFVIVRDLRQAIAKGELFLEYQPVVQLSNRSIVGVEALLRWQNPSLGMVPPDRFVPLAEDSGLIHDIGAWVIAEACRQGALWQRAAKSFSVAVNISPMQLRRAGFAQSVMEIIARQWAGEGGACLVIEITESAVMENIDLAITELGRLKNAGLSVSIDDFGTGYSSLSRLRSLPIDSLKIDRSFVRDLETDSSAVAVANGIIALAHSLGLRVIAEGIETEGQLAILRQHGCDAGQG
ncbi:MAG TPA: EAL domain-containing protein, partial [Burkholderiales bacterium]|nr:EAL domain-containing protein [Burkholderiales bacterium]